MCRFLVVVWLTLPGSGTYYVVLSQGWVQLIKAGERDATKVCLLGTYCKLHANLSRFFLSSEEANTSLPLVVCHRDFIWQF